MTTPAPCGEACVWNGIAESALIPLTASVRPEAAAMVEGRVLKHIPARGHSAEHPLYLDDDDSVATRRALLQRLRDDPPPHVVPVVRVCECSFESPFLRGRPMRDFGLGSDGRALVPPSMRKPDWTPEEVRRFLAKLATGLIEMHARGIAHGDPVLANAFISGAERTAVWTDISSVRPATDHARRLDVAAFVFLCVWPALVEYPFCSESLFRDVAGATGDDALHRLRAAFLQPRADTAERNPREVRAIVLRDIDASAGNDEQSRIYRYVASVVASRYFLEYSITDASLRFLLTTLDAERARNAIFEEDRTRLMYLRFGQENDRLRALTQQLEELRAQAEQTHERYREEAEMRASKLLERVQELESLEAALRGAFDGKAMELERLEQHRAALAAERAAQEEDMRIASARLRIYEQAEADRVARQQRGLFGRVRRMLGGS